MPDFCCLLHTPAELCSVALTDCCACLQLSGWHWSAPAVWAHSRTGCHNFGVTLGCDWHQARLSPVRIQLVLPKAGGLVLDESWAGLP